MNMIRTRPVHYIVPARKAELPVPVHGARDYRLPDGFVVRRLIDGSLMIMVHPDGSAGGQVLTAADPQTSEAWKDLSREIAALYPVDVPVQTQVQGQGQGQDGAALASLMLPQATGAKPPVWKQWVP